MAVVEVPPRLTARERRRHRKAGKNDERDAVLSDRIVARETDLPPIRPIEVAEDLAAVLAHRDHLVGERTRLAYRVHLWPTTRGCEPSWSAPRSTGLEGLDREIKARARQLAELVTRSGSTMTQLCWAGPIVAARILVAVGDPSQFPTKNEFARMNGTAPVLASSGRTQRHRLNRGDNRQLNRALHTIALAQIRHPTDGRAYYDRNRKERRTGRDALRCVKRRISDAVYRQLIIDARAALTT